MLLKSYITILTLGLGGLAAPLASSAVCTTGIAAVRTRYGYVCKESLEEKRAPEPEPVPEPMPASCTSSTAAARGLGLVCVGTTSTSKRIADDSAEASQPLAKRTGMGIISSGSDDA